MLRRFGSGGGGKGLQREIAEAKALDVFQLPLKFVLMSLFVGYQALEYCFDTASALAPQVCAAQL